MKKNLGVLLVRAVLASVAILASVVLPNVASAGVTGIAEFTNCTGGGFTFSATAFTWSLAGTVAGTGCLLTEPGTALVYSGGTIGAFATGNIKDVTVPLVPTVDDFIDILGTVPLIDFQLSGFTAPSPTNGTTCTPLAVGQSCVPVAGYPILLVDTNVGTNIVLVESGFVTDGVGPANSWIGTLTSQLAGLTPAQIQTTILGTGSVFTTWSEVVTITPSNRAPEPATLALLGVGLAGLGFSRRKH